MEWIIAAITFIFMTIAGGALVIVLIYKSDRDAVNQPSDYWVIEMWNIGHGFKVTIPFANHLVVGRNNIYSYIADDYPAQMDVTISREHCMFYEQSSWIYVWNMSEVNPATINGHRIYQPAPMRRGDRLELGNSVFLVTDINYRCA